MNKFIIYVGQLLICVLLCILNGYVLSTLWQWFIVAKFSAPSLTIPEAIGIIIVAEYLTRRSGKNKIEDFTEKVAEVIVVSLVCLGTGWVVTQFI